MQKINELLKMIEAQEKAGGETCTPGTELELGENMVDSYGKVRKRPAARHSLYNREKRKLETWSLFMNSKIHYIYIHR